jgi:hypothetical protein
MNWMLSLTYPDTGYVMYGYYFDSFFPGTKICFPITLQYKSSGHVNAGEYYVCFDNVDQWCAKVPTLLKSSLSSVESSVNVSS